MVGIALLRKQGSVFRKAPAQVILKRSQMACQAGFQRFALGGECFLYASVVLRHPGAAVAKCCEQLLLQRCNSFQHNLLVGIILLRKLGGVFRKTPAQGILKRSQMARQAAFQRFALGGECFLYASVVLRHPGAAVIHRCEQLLLQRCNSFQHNLLVGITLLCKLGGVFRKAPAQGILKRSQMAYQAVFQRFVLVGELVLQLKIIKAFLKSIPKVIQFIWQSIQFVFGISKRQKHILQPAICAVKFGFKVMLERTHLCFFVGSDIRFRSLQLFAQRVDHIIIEQFSDLLHGSLIQLHFRFFQH